MRNCADRCDGKKQLSRNAAKAIQHIENGIAVKAVVAKLKSAGQGCALGSQSRLGQFLWAVWIALKESDMDVS